MHAKKKRRSRIFWLQMFTLTEVEPQCDAVRAATAWLGVAAYRTFGVAWGRCTAAQSFEFSSYENTLTDIYSQSSKTKGFITFLHSYLFDKITYFSH